MSFKIPSCVVGCDSGLFLTMEVAGVSYRLASFFKTQLNLASVQYKGNWESFNLLATDFFF